MPHKMSKAARLRISQAMKASHAAKRAARPLKTGTEVHKALASVLTADQLQEHKAEIEYHWTVEMALRLRKDFQLRLLKDLLEELLDNLGR